MVDNSKSTVAVARRSCDQCRTRKIGCDRGSPCSSCIPARLSCTYSPVATNRSGTKQRVLISAQYEQKINGIAESIDGIKALLRKLDVSKEEERLSTKFVTRRDHVDPETSNQLTTANRTEPVWDYPAHIVEFIKSVVEDVDSKDLQPEASEVFTSLRKAVQTLEGQNIDSPLSLSKTVVSEAHSASSMPPLDVVVMVLRWAKDHETYNRISSMSRILPLQMFTDICRKVYFAVDEYSATDFILANGYLHQIFTQYVLASGRQEHHRYSQLCRANMGNAVSQLPLLLPARMDTAAALILGAFYAIENSKATVAWTFISAAADLCIRLGYHRLGVQRERSQPLWTAQENLFWSIYKVEKGLSLRLGRPSNIRDSEITTSCDPSISSRISFARIQGDIYDQLYSPVGLSRNKVERARMAQQLASELHELIQATNAELRSLTTQPGNESVDLMHVIYLRCDLVCHFSCLALILRAIPVVPNSPGGVSEDCVVAARNALDTHQECMTGIRQRKEDASQITKYINCAIMQGPFAPFSIIFTRAIRLLDVDDLARLNLFATSLQDQADSTDSITHPYRLYELLCQAAQLHFDWNTPSNQLSASADTVSASFNEFEFTLADIEGAEANDTLMPGDDQTDGLSDWYHSNQQFMGLFEDDTIF